MLHNSVFAVQVPDCFDVGKTPSRERCNPKGIFFAGTCPFVLSLHHLKSNVLRGNTVLFKAQCGKSALGMSQSVISCVVVDILLYSKQKLLYMKKIIGSQGFKI